MKIAGVIVDDYKLSVFRRVLTEAGYTYTEQPGPTPMTTTMMVKYTWVASLKPVIEQAMKECAK